MKLEIVSPEGFLFEGDVQSVSLPGIAGSFDVLPHHAPLIAALAEGILQYKIEGKEEKQKIQGGFVKVKDDYLSVCIQ